jgi:hypothetical protein
MLDSSDEEKEWAPRATWNKAKGQGKARVSYIDSGDDSEDEDLDDDIEDFIADDDEDEEEADARRALKAKSKAKDKGKGTVKRGRAIVLDSEDEWEAEEAEVVFGRKKDEKPLTEEQLKFMPKFLPSTKMKVGAVRAFSSARCQRLFPANDGHRAQMAGEAARREGMLFACTCAVPHRSRCTR